MGDQTTMRLVVAAFVLPVPLGMSALTVLAVGAPAHGALAMDRISSPSSVGR
jgi:hypothetical protein